MGSVRRGGVIIAMSSGLVASMALPAHATAIPPEAAGPVTASIPVVPASGAGETLVTAREGGLLALPPDLVTDDVAVAAPATATVDFDHASFTVVPDAGAGGTPSADSPSADRGSTASGNDANTSVPVSRKELRQWQTPASPAVKAAPVPTSAGGKLSAPPKATATSATALGAKAVAIAFRYEGTPYLWGGTTPRGFDCSGFTRYVYGQLGRKLGRTVSDQRGDVKIVPRSKAKAGDLVFFGANHIGIYVGGNQMIDSPRRGKSVQARKIYSANVSFGRVAG